MDPLLITTTVDLSGANQLASGVEAAMARVVQAQLRVKAETNALKDAYAQLGPSAQAGSAAATSAIAQHEASLVTATSALKSAKAAVDELNSSEEAETATLGANISARQSATASISLAEGRMMGANRAAGAFLATTLGLGPALQAAFPVIGALALVEVLIHVGGAIRDATEALVGWDKAAKQAYAETEKANERAIAQQVALKIGATELGVVGTEGASRAAAEVTKWTEQEKILQQAIADTARNLGTVRSQIEELNARQKPPAPAEAMGPLGTALNAPWNLAQKALPPPADIPATENLDTLTKKQEELNKLVEKYSEELQKIQQIHKPGAEALVPLAEAKQAEQLGAAQLEAREKSGVAEIALAEATSKHLLEIGKISAQQEAAAFGEAEQKKIDIRIKALQQLDALKEKSPTYSQDASAQSEVARNQGEIAALQSQRQTVAVETADKVEKAEVEAAIKSVDLQIDAAQRGSQTKIALTQKEVEIATAAYGKQGAVYDAAVAKNLAAITEFEEKRSQLLQRDIRLATEEANQEEKTAEQAIKAKQDELAAETDIQNRQIQQQRQVGTGGRGSVLDIALIRSTYQQQEDLASSSAAQQIALANQAKAAAIAAQDEIIAANQKAAAQDTVNQQRELDAIAEAEAKKITIAQETVTQIDAIEAKAAKERAQIEQQEAQQEIQTYAQVADFFESQFQRMIFSARTGKQAIQGLVTGLGEEIYRILADKLKAELLSGLLSKLGLGVQGAGGGGAAGAAGAAASAARQQATASTQAVAGSTMQVAATQQTVASTTMSVASTLQDTAATLMQAAATQQIIAANIMLAASTASAAGGAAGGAGGAASFLSAILAFDQGGVVPYTGLHLLHQDERVLTPRERADYESGGGYRGGSGGGSSSSSSSNVSLHYHDSRSVSSVDTHGLHDLLARKPRALGQLMEGLFQSGNLDVDALKQRMGY
jgi:hypothetical protein